MNKKTYFVVYWAGTPVYQTTDELAADAIKNTYRGAIVKQSSKKIMP
jgi:hypothetical protein